jgi:hypothetical protein
MRKEIIMKTYNVHIYREMRLYYPGIKADSPEQAAQIAACQCSGHTENIEDCEGENLGALVDVAGDEEYAQSQTIDFEPVLLRDNAQEMLAVLEYAIETEEGNWDGDEPNWLQQARAVTAKVRGRA